VSDVRIHDLRHTFASGGLLVGEGLAMIGKKLLGLSPRPPNLTKEARVRVTSVQGRLFLRSPFWLARRMASANTPSPDCARTVAWR